MLDLTTLQHHSAGDDIRRNRVHFKHTYTSKKTNEHIPKTRRKIFYGSPKASSQK